MKATQHFKERLLERTNLNHLERRIFTDEAVKYGKRLNSIKDKDLKEFLKSKERYHKRTILYKDYVIIHSNKQLYTVYEVPERFKGVS